MRFGRALPHARPFARRRKGARPHQCGRAPFSANPAPYSPFPLAFSPVRAGYFPR